MNNIKYIGKSFKNFKFGKIPKYKIKKSHRRF